MLGLTEQRVLVCLIEHNGMGTFKFNQFQKFDFLFNPSQHRFTRCMTCFSVKTVCRLLTP
jgi:hypothetical protein